ncbi:APC family permease [Spiroplasma kunkelii]|uniref:hypothetical protein n=1 Tax=Spiroplasma kunkelii TaxID=47834 RepID=UPI000321A1E1|nr:hypothetical protein [Spiroplasma kunkelii]
MFGILILFGLVLMQLLIKKSSGYSQIIFALLKGLPIVLVLIIVMVYGNTSMEAITYVSGEVINPRKNIPPAMIIATIMIVILYIILAIGLLTINKPQAWIGPNGFNNVWYYAIINNPAIPPVLNYLFSILSIFIFVGSLNSIFSLSFVVDF